jgi:hypothetical protein
MIQCPHCHKETREIRISGPVLIAVGVVEVDESGSTIVATSPFKAIQTIEVGTELRAPGFLLECPSCHYTGELGSYTILSMCTMTGKGTSFSVQTPFGSLFVVPEMGDKALLLFTEANASAESAIQSEELF